MKKILLCTVLIFTFTKPALASEDMLWQMGSDFLHGGVDRLMDRADDRVKQNSDDQDSSHQNHNTIEPAAGDARPATAQQSPRRAETPSSSPRRESPHGR